MSESDDNPKKELINAGVELLKTTYEDALQPLAKETGKALGTLGKTVNIMLSPLHGLVWGWDRISEYVTQTVERKLQQRNVPKERLQCPDPDVAVPALEALRYSKLRDNFAALLATSMDSATAQEAHPAFVEILKEMTSDEARILQCLPPIGRAEPLLDIAYELPDKGEFIIFRHASMLGEDANCDHPALTPKYIDNLCRLGLVHVPELRALNDDWRYDRLRESKIVTAAKNEVPNGGQLVLNKKMIGLTNLGDSFRKACVIDAET